MKILVIAPHPDDELLGVGGTLLKKKDEGNEIGWLIMSKMYEKFGWDRNKCISFIMDPNARLSKLGHSNSDQICQYLGDWEHHVNSWTQQNEVPYSLFKYEELLTVF